MKLFNLTTTRSWIILLLYMSNACVVQGQDEFTRAFNSSMSGYLRNVLRNVGSIFRRPKPRPSPIRAPVKAPVKVPTPVVAPKAVPVSVPRVAPVPVPTPRVVSVPVPTPRVVPVPVPVPRVAPVPVPTPRVVPVPVPTPRVVPVPVPRAVPVPVPVPFTVPVRIPSITPSMSPIHVKPVVIPTSAPTSAPVLQLPPNPVSVPISLPSNHPTMVPNSAPMVAPLPSAPQVTVLYTHGDAPYEADQAVRLEAQMKSVPNDAEFVVFVGDLRKAGATRTCRREEYEEVARLFRFSRAPVFVLIGDNDSNDCPNIAEGLQYWNDNFLNFESRYWNHTFQIRRQEGYPDNFAFTHKKSLFVGLNIIGGMTRDTTEWELRLSAEAVWTINRIRDYLSLLRQTGEGNVGRIVIFGHADPGGRHAPFFQPIASFIENELKNQVPVLYVNGDKHEWTYTTSFYGKSSWLRVGVEGLAVDPLVKITIDGNGKTIDPVQAFAIDRRM